MLKIQINGKQYPCYVTMGALVKVEKELGHSITKMKPDSLEELLTLMWCQCWGACRREGIEFPFSLEDFADALEQEEFTKWAIAQAQGEVDDSAKGKKKVK